MQLNTLGYVALNVMMVIINQQLKMEKGHVLVIMNDTSSIFLFLIFLSITTLFLLACDCGSSSCSKTDGSCNCTIGYSGYDCNNCADGYYMTDLVNGKVNCSGEY